MNTSFTFNALSFLEIDPEDIRLSARKRFSSTFGEFLGEPSDLDILDNILYEYPTISKDESDAMAILWADVLAKQIGFRWYLVRSDHAERLGIATTDPVVYVIFPQCRIAECLTRSSRSFRQAYFVALIEFALASGATPFGQKTLMLIKQDVESLKYLESLSETYRANQ